MLPELPQSKCVDLTIAGKGFSQYCNLQYEAIPKTFP